MSEHSVVLKVRKSLPLGHWAVIEDTLSGLDRFVMILLEYFIFWSNHNVP